MSEENPKKTEAVQINEHQMNQLMSRMKDEQNLALGVLGGFIAASVGAALWAAITAATGYQIGWMAVGVGFLVGFAVRHTGKGLDKIYGVNGAVFSLLGCLAGNFFTMIYLVSAQEGVSFWQLLSTVDLSLIINVTVETFEVMDVLFYGIAIYEGYRFSFRQLTEEELSQISRK